MYDGPCFEILRKLVLINKCAFIKKVDVNIGVNVNTSRDTLYKLANASHYHATFLNRLLFLARKYVQNVYLGKHYLIRVFQRSHYI